MSQTKYVIKFTTQFRKDYKLAMKRGLKIELLEQIVALLAAGQSLPEKNKDHALRSRTYRQLGRTSRMSHPARLAFGLPG